MGEIFLVAGVVPEAAAALGSEIAIGGDVGGEQGASVGHGRDGSSAGAASIVERRGVEDDVGGGQGAVAVHGSDHKDGVVKLKAAAKFADRVSLRIGDNEKFGHLIFTVGLGEGMHNVCEGTGRSSFNIGD